MKRNEFHVRLTFSRRQLKAAAALGLLVALAYGLRSDTLKLSTYYPAPSGVYKKIITTAQTVLARDGGNVGIGTTSPKSPAPNNQAGNLDVNDVYLRSTSRWLSQSGGGEVSIGGNLTFHSAHAQGDHSGRPQTTTVDMSTHTVCALLSQFSQPGITYDNCNCKIEHYAKPGSPAFGWRLTSNVVTARGCTCEAMCLQ